MRPSTRVVRVIGASMRVTSGADGVGDDVLDAAAEDRHVEIGGDAEARAVEAQPSDEVDRGATEHRQPDVVDHLALVVLVDGDGARALGRRRPPRRRGTGTG